MHDLMADDSDGAAMRLQQYVAGLIHGCLHHLGPLQIEALDDGTEFVHALQVTNTTNGVQLLISVDVVPA
jgi:hypothetical protein